MSNTLASMRGKISGASDLRSVVRTMKSVAASNITQYENSVHALGDYCRKVELGLSVCFKNSGNAPLIAPHSLRNAQANIGVVVFGSDQGLVGQFNDRVTNYARQAIAKFPGKPKVWAVGARVHALLSNAGITPAGMFPLPHSIKMIAPLVSKILIDTEMHAPAGSVSELHLFYNHPTSKAGYEPGHLKLLPLDEKWRKNLMDMKWPTASLPEPLGDLQSTMGALIREYLFVSLFRACAESLASENASRLAAMQRADKNIDDLLTTLNRTFHRLRQGGIDEELFDVISGFEALK